MLQESRLVCTREGRIMAGVCTGLGRYTHIDPVVFRVGFAVLVLAGHGAGIFLYIAAFLFMPSDEVKDSIAEQVLKRRFGGDAVLTILGALLTAIVVSSVIGGGLTMSTGPLAVVTVFALILLVAHARGADLIDAARSLPARFQGAPVSRGERPSDTPPTDVGGRVDLADLADAAAPESPPTGAARSGTTRVLPTDQLPPEPSMVQSLPPEPPPPYPSWSAAAPIVTAGSPRRTSPRGGSRLTSLSLLAALGAGAAMIPITSHQPIETRVSVPIAAALAVLGAGLVIASWYGRSRGLISLGVVLCLALVTTSAVGELPQGGRWGDVHWRPADSRAEQSYKVVVGEGNLDLTGLPLSSGQRVRVHAEVALGEIKVTVPVTATTEVHARSSLGDVDVAGKVTPGPRARVDVVLTAEGKINKNAPVIELHVRGRIGDVQVRRG